MTTHYLKKPQIYILFQLYLMFSFFKINWINLQWSIWRRAVAIFTSRLWVNWMIKALSVAISLRNLSRFLSYFILFNNLIVIDYWFRLVMCLFYHKRFKYLSFSESFKYRMSIFLNDFRSFYLNIDWRVYLIWEVRLHF